MPEVRPLPSAGITRHQRSYGPVRLPIEPPPNHGVRSCDLRPIGPPPITRIALPACCAHYPGGSERVRLPVPSPSHTAFPVTQSGRHPHRYFRGLLRLYTLRPAGLLNRPRRPLSQGSSPLGYPNEPPVSYSINRLTIEMESSSIGNTRPRGALGKGALFAPCPRRQRDGGHAALCPPYDLSALHSREQRYLRREIGV